MHEAWLRDKDWIRIRVSKEKGKVAGFLVAYEAEINGKRYEVARYDTCHGFPHKDVMKPDGSKTKERLPDLELKDLVRLSRLDLQQNWRKYRKAFERELHG